MNTGKIKIEHPFHLDFKELSLFGELLDINYNDGTLSLSLFNAQYLYSTAHHIFTLHLKNISCADYLRIMMSGYGKLGTRVCFMDDVVGVYMRDDKETLDLTPYRYWQTGFIYSRTIDDRFINIWFGGYKPGYSTPLSVLKRAKAVSREFKNIHVFLRHSGKTLFTRLSKLRIVSTQQRERFIVGYELGRLSDAIARFKKYEKVKLRELSG